MVALLIVAGILVVGGIWFYVAHQSSQIHNQNRIAGPGETCGGSLVNPYICQTGHHCEYSNNPIPSPGEGGICVSDSTPTVQNPIPTVNPTQNTSTISLGIPFEGYQFTLYAPDQVATSVVNEYCGAVAAGAAMYDGTYKIIAAKGTTTVSTVALGQMEFVAGMPHDGLHVVTYTPTGDQLVEINEYGSCNGDFSSFYTINSNGQVVSIPFVANGTSTQFIYSGWIDPNAPVDGTFCGYNNVVGLTLCDAYQYKNYSFIRTDAWVEEGGSGKPTDIGRAMRYLFDAGDSGQLKPYIPSDAQYIDEFDDVQTSTLPYKFQVHFARPGTLNDYNYIFTVNKTQNGFQAILPPQHISK